MKRTTYKAMISAGLIESKWQRVYEEDQKYYIKRKGEYICISGTPAEAMMVED